MPTQYVLPVLHATSILPVLQAGDSFPITVSLKPSPEMLSHCAKHVAHADSEILEIPMRLAVPDQKLPVHFTVRVQLTTSDLVFEPPCLDFGECVMPEGKALSLRVTNPGRLPQVRLCGYTFIWFYGCVVLWLYGCMVETIECNKFIHQLTSL